MLEDVDQDGEIEFLDEDADIVQQCVQYVENVVDVKPVLTGPLLIERVSGERMKTVKRRRKKEIDDTDYDPSRESQRIRKRKQQNIVPRQSISRVPLAPKSGEPLQPVLRKTKIVMKIDIGQRKKLGIKIPDYEDPLCLPVRAIKTEDSSVLKSWNNLCLEQFKRFDKPLRAENLETVSSKRTIILRNQRNLTTKKIDTTMYSKLSVENESGAKKAELLQSVLPKYREKKVLNNYRFEKRKHKPNNFRHRTEVLLTKEDSRDGETLVVYDTKDSVSSIYRMCETKSDESSNKDDEDKKYLEEITCCKVCARCYQASWRGKSGPKKEKKIMICQICKQPLGSLYKLLLHYKEHSSSEIRSIRSSISRMLTKAVTYHYKCRICQKVCPSIKLLRDHLSIHKGTTAFICEVGNHVTN